MPVWCQAVEESSGQPDEKRQANWARWDGEVAEVRMWAGLPTASSLTATALTGCGTCSR